VKAISDPLSSINPSDVVIEAWEHRNDEEIEEYHGRLSCTFRTKSERCHIREGDSAKGKEHEGGPHFRKRYSHELEGDNLTHYSEFHLAEINKEVSSPVGFQLYSTDHLNMLKPVHSLLHLVSTNRGQQQSITNGKDSGNGTSVGAVFPLFNNSSLG